MPIIDVAYYKNSSDFAENACYFAISLLLAIRTDWFWGEGVLATK